MAQNGMLSKLFGIPAIDPAAQQEEERLQALSGARMNPLAYTAYSGGAQAGRGLGTALAGLTGRDVRTPTAKRTDAIEAAKAQVAQLGLDPEDPKSIDEFYRRVIHILRKQGLVGEAMDVDGEWQERKNKREDLDIKRTKEAGVAGRDEAKRLQVDERNAILKNKNLPELARMIDVVESFDPVLQGPQRKMRVEALNAMLESKKKGIVLEDAGDRVIVRDRASGAKITEDKKGAAPLGAKDAAREVKEEKAVDRAYRNTMAVMQSYYDAAVRLHNHQGVEEITGRRGLLISDAAETAEGIVSRGAKIALSAAGRDAFAIWKQVTGGAFVAALDDLKRNSPTGSTGLGQTSNIEGTKVQSAKGALSREPDAPDFRENLRVYIQLLEQSADNFGKAAQVDEVAPIPLGKKPLNAAAQGAPARRPAATPAAPAGDQFGWSIRKKQ